MKDKNRITTCPSCQCRYRAPAVSLGRKLSCKQCGAAFRIEFQNEDHQKKRSLTPSIERKAIDNISQKDSYLVIGKLAVKNSFIDESQLREALSIQNQERLAGKKSLLGTILVAQGMISSSQLDYLLSIQKIFETRKLDRRFGTIAVKNEFATREEIDRALQEQKRVFKETRHVKFIGDILVESKVLSADQRDAILIRQQRFEETVSTEQKEFKAPEPQKQIKIDAKFDLTVTEDRLNASISIKKEGDVPITVEHIKEFLDIEGIKFGVTSDSQIAEYLNNKDGQNHPLKIAEGKPPEPGKDACIKYYFDVDPLKVGAVKTGGAIDFKDRGDIPQVKEGDLLVEKMPVVEGLPGEDIYGCSIPAPKPGDKTLRKGKGTSISEDRLKIFAKIEGMPEMSALGKVYVSPKLEISGDVGLKTGHVEFDGKIHVTGSIQNGFRVKGNSLTAKEILKAEIDIDGDIVVSGGIIGASIRTGGNIRAVYVRESDIVALGDVIVEKEIIDSKIDTSGECVVNKGAILSSMVSAKMGINAIQIGSEISRACNLKVGFDEKIKKEIDEIKEAIPLKREEQKEYRQRLKELEDKPAKIEKEIADMAQLQDRAVVKKRNLLEEIEQLKSTGKSAQLLAVEAELKALESKIKKEEQKLERLFDKQDQITDEVSGLNQKIEDSKTQIQELREKIVEIMEWSSARKGTPKVRVQDVIFADTRINGIYSSLVLNQNQKSVLIKEDVVKSSDDTSKWTSNQEKYGSKIRIRPL